MSWGFALNCSLIFLPFCLLSSLMCSLVCNRKKLLTPSVKQNECEGLSLHNDLLAQLPLILNIISLMGESEAEDFPFIMFYLFLPSCHLSLLWDRRNASSCFEVMKFHRIKGKCQKMQLIQIHWLLSTLSKSKHFFRIQIKSILFDDANF